MDDDSKGTPGAAAQESSRDLTKLLISLASAVAVLSATFAEKLSEHVGAAILILFVAWILLALSVFFGVQALDALVHAQWTAAQKWGELTFPSMRRSWRCFLAGLIFLLTYAAIGSGLQAWSKTPLEMPSVACACTTPVPAPADAHSVSSRSSNATIGLPSAQPSLKQ